MRNLHISEYEFYLFILTCINSVSSTNYTRFVYMLNCILDPVFMGFHNKLHIYLYMNAFQENSFIDLIFINGFCKW